MKPQDRPFARFVAAGVRKRFIGKGGGVLFAAALAALAVSSAATPAQAQVVAAVVSTERAVSQTSPTDRHDIREQVRSWVRMLRARPGDTIVKLAQGLALPDGRADQLRLLAGSAGKLLKLQADAGGYEAKVELSDLLETGARGAAANGQSLIDIIEAMTALDPRGEIVAPMQRDSLFYEIAARAYAAGDTDGGTTAGNP